MSLTDEFRTSRLDGLVALRDLLTEKVEQSTSDRDIAALSLRLIDVTEKIAEIERAQPASKGTPLDELTKRRAERQSPARPSRTARHA